MLYFPNRFIKSLKLIYYFSCYFIISSMIVLNYYSASLGPRLIELRSLQLSEFIIQLSSLIGILIRLNRQNISEQLFLQFTQGEIINDSLKQQVRSLQSNNKNNKYNRRQMSSNYQNFELRANKINQHRKGLTSMLSLKRSILQYQNSPGQKQVAIKNSGKGSSINISNRRETHAQFNRNKQKQNKTIHTDSSITCTSERLLQKKYNCQNQTLSTSKTNNIQPNKNKVFTNRKCQQSLDMRKEIHTKIFNIKYAQTITQLSKKALNQNVIQARTHVHCRTKSSYRIQARKPTAADKQHEQIQRLINELNTKKVDSNSCLKQTIQSCCDQNIKASTVFNQFANEPINGNKKTTIQRSTMNVRPSVKAKLQMKREKPKELLKERYQLLQRIGKGFSGEAYKAKDILSDRIVAIKIITQTTKKQEQYEFYKTIQHKNIVEYYNNFVCNGNRYLVLQYFPFTLHKLCRIRKISQKQAKRILKALGNGLMFLHSMSIAHRDIKLDNIVVSQDLSDIKFIDFGLCIDLSKCENQKTKQFCGTIQYMPPQILQKKAYNPKKADIWSLGVLLYRLLYNRYPFTGRDQFSLLEKMRKNKITLSEDCDNNLALLLEGMLNKNSSDRYTIMEIIESKWLYQ